MKTVRVDNGSVNFAGAKFPKDEEIGAGGVRSRTGVEIKSRVVIVWSSLSGRESYIDGGNCNGCSSPVSQRGIRRDFTVTTIVFRR